MKKHLSSKRPSSKALIYCYALQRKFMWEFLVRRNNSILVSEYPKSGGTWFAQMLADYYELPFPRNTIKPELTQSILHGHQKYRDYNDNMFTVVRDGRDVMVSFYHHFLMPNDWNHHATVEKNIRKIGIKDVEDVKYNLPSFIEYISVEWPKKSKFTWQDFIFQWVKPLPGNRVVAYEDLLEKPETTMLNALNSLSFTGEVDIGRVQQIIEKNSFKNVSGREQGKESKVSFVRKGIKGDWNNHFTDESLDVFNKYNGEAMKFLGYY